MLFSSLPTGRQLDRRQTAFGRLGAGHELETHRRQRQQSISRVLQIPIQRRSWLPRSFLQVCLSMQQIYLTWASAYISSLLSIQPRIHPLAHSVNHALQPHSLAHPYTHSPTPTVTPIWTSCPGWPPPPTSGSLSSNPKSCAPTSTTTPSPKPTRPHQRRSPSATTACLSGSGEG